MPMRIKRIAHGDVVYTLGEKWPGEVRNGESTGLVVGMINYTGEYTIEHETEPTGVDDEGNPVGDPLTEKEIAYYEVVQLPAELYAFYMKVEPGLVRGELTDESRSELSGLLDRFDAKKTIAIVRRIWRDRVAVQVEDQENPLRPFFVSLLNRLLDAGRTQMQAQSEVQAAPS
jgi:hypothetical protein